MAGGGWRIHDGVVGGDDRTGAELLGLESAGLHNVLDLDATGGGSGGDLRGKEAANGRGAAAKGRREGVKSVACTRGDVLGGVPGGQGGREGYLPELWCCAKRLHNQGWAENPCY
ncbi:MAG: hypothetical protein ACYS4W_01540 [Planctomycetota bacterium]